MFNVDNCEDEWTVKGGKGVCSIDTNKNKLAFGELVVGMCDHHEGLSPTEVDVLYNAAVAFIKEQGE